MILTLNILPIITRKKQMNYKVIYLEIFLSNVIKGRFAHIEVFQYVQLFDVKKYEMFADNFLLKHITTL